MLDISGNFGLMVSKCQKRGAVAPACCLEKVVDGLRIWEIRNLSEGLKNHFYGFCRGIAVFLRLL